VCPARSECPVQSATHSESLVQSHSLIPDNPRPSRVHPNRVVRPLYCQKVSVTPLRLTVCNRKKKEVKKEEEERRKESSNTSYTCFECYFSSPAPVASEL
jgi:hypothetical protein